MPLAHNNSWDDQFPARRHKKGKFSTNLNKFVTLNSAAETTEYCSVCIMGVHLESMLVAHHTHNPGSHFWGELANDSELILLLARSPVYLYPALLLIWSTTAQEHGQPESGHTVDVEIEKQVVDSRACKVLGTGKACDWCGFLLQTVVHDDRGGKSQESSEELRILKTCSNVERGQQIIDRNASWSC